MESCLSNVIQDTQGYRNNNVGSDHCVLITITTGCKKYGYYRSVTENLSVAILK